MQDQPLGREVPDPEPIDFDRYAAYEDGVALVVCDRTNPTAWMRAEPTAVATLDP
ncbi:DUF7331 family protein [Haloplanus sp.]|uniref:DUF7331 family protein n=1 Tax=Haloplanus sp. TaxID=1961696 RepID=UPI00261E940F|nr:hypothetical protein [Haloplanus sp.]